MAEWLGQLMANWPVWLIAVTAIIIFICGIIYYFVDATVLSSAEPYWRKKHGKK